MLHSIVKVRFVLAMTAAAAIGTWGVPAYPVRLADELFLKIIYVRKPALRRPVYGPRRGS